MVVGDKYTFQQLYHEFDYPEWEINCYGEEEPGRELLVAKSIEGRVFSFILTESYPAKETIYKLIYQSL